MEDLEKYSTDESKCHIIGAEKRRYINNGHMDKALENFRRPPYGDIIKLNHDHKNMIGGGK